MLPYLHLSLATCSLILASGTLRNAYQIQVLIPEICKSSLQLKYIYEIRYGVYVIHHFIYQLWLHIMHYIINQNQLKFFIIIINYMGA